MKLTVDEQENIYYEAPAPSRSSRELAEYLAYMNAPDDQEHSRPLTRYEKEMLYYFDQLGNSDKQDFIAFLRIRAQRVADRHEET